MRQVILGILATGVVVGATHGTIVWDAGADWSIGNGNPNGAWTYGSADYLSPGVTVDVGTFTPFALAKTAADYKDFPPDPPTPANPATLEIWQDNDLDPNANSNRAATDYNAFGITFVSNRVNLSPANGPVTLARWTAPSAGLYDIAAEFFNVQGFADDIYVYIAGAQVFASRSPDSKSVLVGTPYSTTGVALNAGDAVFFGVGNFYYTNNTGLEAIITRIPEPASSMLLGLATLLGARFRRHRAYSRCIGVHRGQS